MIWYEYIKQKKIEPRIKLNHNIATAFRLHVFVSSCHFILLLGTETEENEKGSSVHCNDSPPQLSIKLPRIRDLPKTSKPWSNTELPIDVLLLTVKDCEFLSCFFYLDKPFKSYCKDMGYVYLGSLGSGDQNKLKIALIKCSKGSAVPSGSLTVVKNAARILRPKAVFSVGTCIGLNSDRAKRGDVVVSSKLTTPFYRTPVSRNIGNLIRHAADGWTAPLENPDVWEVGVHCDGDVLSHSEAASFGWRHEDIIQKYAEAIAVETEGEGNLTNNKKILISTGNHTVFLVHFVNEVARAI